MFDIKDLVGDNLKGVENEMILKMVEQGLPLDKISEKIGIPESELKKLIEKLGK